MIETRNLLALNSTCQIKRSILSAASLALTAKKTLTRWAIIRCRDQWQKRSRKSSVPQLTPNNTISFWNLKELRPPASYTRHALPVLERRRETLPELCVFAPSCLKFWRGLAD